MTKGPVMNTINQHFIKQIVNHNSIRTNLIDQKIAYFIYQKYFIKVNKTEHEIFKLRFGLTHFRQKFRESNVIIK